MFWSGSPRFSVRPFRSSGSDPSTIETAPDRPFAPLDDQSASAGHAEEVLERALLGRVSVVIPTLNEAECIAQVLARIPTFVREVIVVDGLSTDGTPEVAAAARPDVRVVHQQVRGKGAAIRAGIEEASGDYIVLMDGDGSTDPAYIATFARVLAGGADYVKASRFLPGSGTDDMPFHRRIGNSAFVLLARVLFGTRFTDITYGFNAVRRDKCGAMALEIDGWAQEIVTNLRMVRHGVRVEEIPAFEPRRIAGVAKLGTWSAGWSILCEMVAERGRPLAPQTNARRSVRNPSQQLVAVKVHGTAALDPWLGLLSHESPGSLVGSLRAPEGAAAAGQDHAVGAESVLVKT